MKHISGLDSAFEMWTYLQNQYGKESNQRKCRIFRKLCSVQMQEDQTIDDYIIEIRQLLTELKAAKGTIDDQHVVAIIHRNCQAVIYIGATLGINVMTISKHYKNVLRHSKMLNFVL